MLASGNSTYLWEVCGDRQKEIPILSIDSSILSDDGFIFIPEQNQNGFFSIGKYRINDNF